MPSSSKINKVRYLSAAVGIATVVAGGVAVAPLASADTSTSISAHVADQRARTFELVGKQTSIEDLDLGRAGISPGDQRVIHEDLYRDGEKVGDHSVVCTYTHVNPAALQCLGTFSLPEGQFAAQALLHLPAPSYVDVGITGGSGDYSNARGFVRTVPAGDTERHLTVHLKR
ncbi:allene oxide cyclase barrel-like domain-containing protein [Streptomyces sp. NBC_00623]|uniref:allene oxide cyclase barrel-like domain-containing protein n=1 Tax=Streptomyces sp. NBC_00623 TaxID=2975790 RepID=UPI0030DFF7A0